MKAKCAYFYSAPILPGEEAVHEGALGRICWSLCSSFHKDGSFHPNVPTIKKNKRGK